MWLLWETGLRQTGNIMIITKKLLNTAKTKNGGFTRAQVEFLGFEWPPTKNMQKELIGTEMSAERFEKLKSLAGKYAKKTDKKLFSGDTFNVSDLNLSELLNLRDRCSEQIRKLQAPL